MNEEPARSRGLPLTILAVLMGLLAFSNLMKPITQLMDPQSTAGLVFFGHRLHGMTNAIIAPLFGVLLTAYAYGVWTSQRWVVPLAIGYAIYVLLNLILYTANASEEEKSHLVFNVIYASVAIGVSGGAAVFFFLNRDRLS